MSNYNSIIEQNNTELEGILDTINTLPDAGPSVEFGWFSISGISHSNGNYKFPFIVGMTWAEWLETSLNMSFQITDYGASYGSSTSEGYISFGYSSATQGAHVSIDGTETGRVVLEDQIQNEYVYSPYLISIVCCFATGTQVLTSLDGDTKAIEDVVVGEHIVSYNIDTGENYIAEVKRVIIHENTTDIAEVYFDNGSFVTMNAYHPLYTENGFRSITGYMGYEELVVGDNVKTAHGWTTITAINRYVSEPIVTYNIDVRDIGEEPDDDINDTFYANGIVAHNPPPTC